MKLQKYLTIPERIELIKQLQRGVYIIKNKKGEIRKRVNKKLYSKPCKLIDVLEKLADVKEIGRGSYGKAMQICMPKEDCISINVNNKNIKLDRMLLYSIKEIVFHDYMTYNTLIDNPDRYENVEIRMLQLLSAFVFSKATPHINLPVMSFVCEPNKHSNVKQLSENPTKRYIVSELADLGNMYSFINKNMKQWKYNIIIWKVIFFQLLSTLAIIHIHYPNFLHNDLKPDNILVRSTKPQGNTDGYFEYTINGTTYHMPDVGFQLLLWDFDFSCIAGVIDNDKIIGFLDEPKANLVCHRNQYYDIHMCFGLMSRIWGNTMPKQASKWLSEHVLTDQLPSAESDERLLEAIEYTTPAKLIKQDFFSQFTATSDQPTTKTIIERYTGTLEQDIKFDFGDNENRYTDPQNCSYQTYIFFDPKNITPGERVNFKNRYKCQVASYDKHHIKTFPMTQYNNIKTWVYSIISLYDVSFNISNKEKIKIINSSFEFFEMFIKYYNVTTTYLYAIMVASMMYASYKHILSYIEPFNNFEFWYSQTKLNDLNPGELEDVYKQFCSFVARYIENGSDNEKTSDKKDDQEENDK